MYDPKISEKIFNKIGITGITSKNSQIPDKIQGGFIKSHKLEGKRLACFLGHVLMKISKINMYVISLLQIPIIYKAFADKDSKENKIAHGIKQIFKSMINIPLAVLGGAMLGTLFHKKGSASTLLATGVGAYMGTKAGEYLEEKIDKI